ncbi:hypothetical protein [Demetria terragena]|uniref:hypothetical protein n=1 Tax=Demetria terragena TaxID=63959 RepID=UPI000380BCC4
MGTLSVTTWIRGTAQVVLAGFLLFAGLAHLTFARTEFYAQIPPWMPGDADFIVVASGVIEIIAGAAVLLSWRNPTRAWAGWAVAALFVAVFPGNISQFVEQRDAFGLTTDSGRAIRLLFQPLLIAWALWCTGAWTWWRRRQAATAADPQASGKSG